MTELLQGSCRWAADAAQETGRAGKRVAALPFPTFLATLFKLFSRLQLPRKEVARDPLEFIPGIC
jgi:hypothetical protein